MTRLTRISTILFLSLHLCVGADLSGQEGITITGKILGAGNRPVSGVSIGIEGVYSEPVVTDSTGTFQTTAPDGSAWLIITPLEGYKPRREYLNNRRNLVIRLTDEDLESGFDEVLNLFQNERRRNMITSFAAPDPGEALHFPYQSIDQFLQHTVPGMLATGSSGMPGSGAVSYLRGVKSMYTNNQPLYVVDGLPLETPGLFQSQLDGSMYNPMSSIDPLDITDITILKDFMGTAIYGMRGSNGVVLIETLEPDEVETTIDVAMRTGLSQAPDQIPQLDAGHYKALSSDVLMSSGIPEEDFIELYAPLYSTRNDKENYKYNHNTNWQDLIFSDAVLRDFYLRVRGGDEIARYGLSVSYLDHEGVINTTSFDRFNVRFVGNFNIFQWLRMFVSTNLNTGSANLKESSLVPQTSPILTALLKQPLLVPYEYDEDGNPLTTLENVGPLKISNPLAVIDKFEGTKKNNRATTSLRIEGDIGSDLRWNSLLGLNFNSLSEMVFLPNRGMELYFDNEVYNVSQSLKNYYFGIYNDNNLNYRKSIGSRHTVHAVAGFRLNTNRLEVDWGMAKNLQENDEYKQLQNGVSFLREMGGMNSRWNRLAFYGGAGYSFADRYFLEANVALENSTRIGTNATGMARIGGRPFGTFYSAGGAWRISGEPFLRDLSWLEDLKLRATYGIAGNDDIGNLSSLDYYTTVHYRESTGMMPGPLATQDLKHEEYSQLSTGIDVSLLANRIRFSLERFDIRTSNLLVFEPQPFYIGYPTVPANLGILRNKGLELSLSWRILEMGRFSWDAGLIAANLDNRVEEIRNDRVVTPFEGGEFISRTGEPVLSFYGWEYLGVFSTSEQAAEAGLTTEKGEPFGAGDAIFNDLSGPDGAPDGVINEYDKTILGSPIPEYYGSISSLFTWGRWSFSGVVQFTGGQEVYNHLRYQNERMTDLSNQSTSVLKRWFYEGQQTDIPRASWGDPLGNTAFSSRWIEDGTYLRIKNLTLAYTVPEQFLFFRNARVFVSATNLYTFHSYLGYDPEFSYSYFTMEQGIDYGLMPHTRSLMMGVKFGL